MIPPMSEQVWLIGFIPRHCLCHQQLVVRMTELFLTRLAWLSVNARCHDGKVYPRDYISIQFQLCPTVSHSLLNLNAGISTFNYAYHAVEPSWTCLDHYERCFALYCFPSSQRVGVNGVGLYVWRQCNPNSYVCTLHSSKVHTLSILWSAQPISDRAVIHSSLREWRPYWHELTRANRVFKAFKWHWL